MQEFFRNVCSARPQGGPAAALGERPLPRESSLGPDEPKPECLPAGTGGFGALASLNGGNDPVTRIVNKRFMRQTAGEEMVSIMGGGGGGGGKEATITAGAAGAWTEVRKNCKKLQKNDCTKSKNPSHSCLFPPSPQEAPCDCAAQSSCLARAARTSARHSHGQCKHRPQESPAGEEKPQEACGE